MAKLLKEKGEVAANQVLFDQSRRFSLVYRAIETSGKPWVAAINGLALGGGFELTLSLPLPRRRRQSKDPSRPAGNQGRAVSRRRRHPARAAHRVAAGCDAVAAEGRGDQSRQGQGAEPDSCHRARGRSDQGRQGLDQGRRQGGRALGREGLQAAGRPGLFQGRHDDVPGRQCDLPPRDLRQLSGGARHHAVRLRGPAAADRRRAARRIALLHPDPAQQGSRGDDPQPVPVDAGIEQGRAASAERAADQGQEARRDRRRLHGRQRRLRLGARRHRRRADRPRSGERRQGQGARQSRDR